MPKRLIYAGIGAIETPRPYLDQMRSIGQQLGESGWLLRSGHDQGAAQSFEMGCIMGDGVKEIFIPWKGFERAPTDHPDYRVPVFTEELYRCAAGYHPNWAACSQATQLMHMADVCQILGEDGTQPADLVICWTKNGMGAGGTGQALRIAKAHNIPIFDLALPDVPKKLCAWVAKLELDLAEAHLKLEQPL